MKGSEGFGRAPKENVVEKDKANMNVVKALLAGLTGVVGGHYVGSHSTIETSATQLVQVEKLPNSDIAPTVINGEVISFNFDGESRNPLEVINENSTTELESVSDWLKAILDSDQSEMTKAESYKRVLKNFERSFIVTERTKDEFGGVVLNERLAPSWFLANTLADLLIEKAGLNEELAVVTPGSDQEIAVKADLEKVTVELVDIMSKISAFSELENQIETPEVMVDPDAGDMVIDRESAEEEMERVIRDESLDDYNGEDLARPALPTTENLTRPVVPADDAERPVFGSEPLTRPALPTEETTRPVFGGKPLTRPFLPTQETTRPIIK